jgi:hypothetical protein
MGTDKKFKIEVSGQRLTLFSSSFRPEKGSVLHSGVFNRELSSFIAAAAILTIIGFFFARYGSPRIPHAVAGVVLFVLLSLLFRKYLFHEPELKAIFDASTGSVTIARRGVLFQKRAAYPLAAISGMAVNRVVLRPENPEGIEIVEKIALHHYTVLPGFGEADEFFIVQLDFGRQTEVLFSTRKGEEAEEVLGKLKGFMDEHVGHLRE